MPDTAVFDSAYASLNAEQKKAVDTVEGPVVVSAGPGTGKTHVLTLRIANILAKTQARADAVLALTFTDSAVRTMRRRLTQIIGEEVARKVTITTFHGFAELVRAEYARSFSETANFRVMGDVEGWLLMREALERSAVDLLRPAKAPYTYVRELRSLYDTLTREAVSLEAYRAWGVQEAALTASDESLLYKRGAQAGTLTKAGQEKVARFEKVEEAARVLEAYDALKRERSVIDFAGLLSDTIARIASDESLRSDLQERYQYILADEHQDANALQHKLLELFAIDDYPNLFVVGDDKQAIYRFQGAEAGAFESFEKRFPRAVKISLASSFRSYQRVLDTAHTIVASTGTHVELSATRGEGGSVSLLVADDPLDERARIAELAHSLVASGVAPHDIAVITRTNETATVFADALSARALPVLRAGDVSLTARPLMRALIALMEYVGDPTHNGPLRIALLAPWWNEPTVELLTFLRTTNDREFTARLSEAHPKTAAIIQACIAYSLTASPVAVFSYIFSESGARDYLLSHAETLEDISLVRKLVMHLEEATYGVRASTFAEAVSALLTARAEGLSPVKVAVTEREGCITVITAHKAKGMEFQYVIIPECTETVWEKGGRGSVIPSPFEQKQSLDDARRLLYVALTRAKDQVYVSYAKESADGRDRLLTALLPADLPRADLQGEALPVLHTTIRASELVRTLTHEYLSSGRLSPSAINEYLESPATFFARRVLRVSEPPAGALVYGTAVHAALAAYFLKESADAVRNAFERVFARSLLTRDATFEKLRSEAWSAFLAAQGALDTLGENVHVEYAASASREVDGELVQFGGKIDAVFRTNDGLVLADFKTGSSVSAKNESYTRQLALYAQMLSDMQEGVDRALLLGISEAGLKEVQVPIGKAEREKALSEFDDVVRELRSGEWRTGSASEYDAVLALLKR